MLGKIVCFETLGCRLNQNESEGAARFFREAGFTCVMSAASLQPDALDDVVLCVVNTCAVTAKAEQKCRRAIRVLLKKYPSVLLLITGCLAQLKGTLPSLPEDRLIFLPGFKKYLLKEIAAEMNGGQLDVTSGAFSLESLHSFVQQRCLSAENCAGVNTSPLVKKQATDDRFSLYTAHFEATSRASLKIQDGCDKNCAFCVIRLARGKSVSLSPDEVLRRVKQIEDAGYAEIVLTGVNLSLYSGQHEGSIFHLGELLEFLIANTAKIKFRLSSLYPEQITKEFCCVLQSTRVQPFFHLSVQSLCDSVLQNMGRSYSKQNVIDAVMRLRRFKDNPFISCDLIAGFPTEGVNDFRETLQACQELNFAWIHVFQYSPREGTSAKDLKPLTAVVRKERAHTLWQIACSGKVSYIRSCEGHIFDAVIEKPVIGVEGGKNTWRALTDNYLHAVFQCDGELQQGSVVRLRITSPMQESIQAGREEECRAQLVDLSLPCA